MAQKLVVNFYGSPGAGKTVAATSLFASLKRSHIDAVLVNEFAHHKVVENNKTALNNQLYIWANQQFNIFAGYHHADVVITDSPMLLGIIYNTQASPMLREVILHEYNKYNNLNLLVTMDGSHPYSMVGRIHSFTQSVTLQNEICEMLDDHEIPYVNYREYTEDEIVELVKEAIK